MAGYFLIWRFSRTTLAVLLTTIWTAQTALGQYTFVQDTDNAGTWSDPAQWTGGPAGTFPNAIDATVLINAPTRSGGSGSYNLTLPATNVTVGEIKVDNTNYNNSYRSNFANGGGHLIFQTSSGPAKYTETIGSAIGATNSQYQFLMPVDLMSDFLISQDNYPNLNTGTTFANLVTGASNLTMTKTGHGGIQFNYNALPSETTFQGQVVINQGGIRLISPNIFSNVSGLTVNSGGQWMLADNANFTANTDWNLASGAVLNLNGTGKATDSPQSVINPEGALRFALGQAGATISSFHNAVVLQSDSVISVAQTGKTGILDGVVSGAGGLTKQGDGTLIVSNGLSSYGGDTRVLSAPTGSATSVLSITNAILADGRDVYMTATRAALDLNFSGADTVRSLFLDGAPQPVGVYGAVGSSDPSDTEVAWITGSGQLNVTTLGVVGVPGDFNNNGTVDAGDYVLWRKGGPLANQVSDPGTVNAQDYEDWRARFGNPPGSGSGLGPASVPEPATIAMLMFIAPLLVWRKVGRIQK